MPRPREAHRKLQKFPDRFHFKKSPHNTPDRFSFPRSSPNLAVMQYARFENMVAPARPHPQLWRLFLGVVTALVLAFLWIFGLIWVTGVLSGTGFIEAMTNVIQPLTPSPGGTALFLVLVAGLGVGAIIAAAIWQKRRPGTLFGPRVRTLRHFVISAGLSLGTMILIALAFLVFIERPTLNMSLGTWLIWLPLGIAAVTAQTGAEEVLFRGYLQSQIAARFASPIAWLVLPALFFGAIHYQPGMPDNLIWPIVTIAALFGLFAGDLTARTGSIGAAWGFHFANNALVLLLVATETSQVTGLSLFRTDTGFNDVSLFSPLIAAEVLTLTAIWALLRKVLAS